MTLEDALDEFLTRCAAVNLSQATISWYDHMVGRFIGSDGVRGCAVADVSPAHVRRFLAARRQQGCRATSCNAYLRALNAFYNWLVKEEILAASPLARVEYMREPGGTKAALSPEHLERLMAAFDRRTFTGFRDYTLCRTFVDTGLRLSEAAQLRVDDLRLVDGVIVVEHGKGDKRREVRVGRQLALDLQRYQRARQRHLAGYEVPWLFPSTRTRGPLGRCSVTRTLARAARRAGLPVSVGAHLLRHTAATRLAENGATAYQVMAQMGHERLATSQRYVHLAAVLNRQTFETLSPLDRMAERPGRR